MQNNGTIIVYRSQQEANLDWFLNECLFPWIYNNFWGIVLAFIICAGIYNLIRIINKSNFN